MSEGGNVLPQACEATEKPSSERNDPVHVRARARLGTTLHEKWRLDKLLGIGGMATVYAATHRNGSRAAVKILHPELTLDPFVRQRFFWEGRVANAVGHPGVVRVLDDDSASDGSLFLITELLEGETLEQRRHRQGGKLDQKEVLITTAQLLDVLSAVHAQRIVHRDLKPENIFLTHSGQIKVLDFGIARSSELSNANSMTQAGLTVGTPAFMAPEQARGLSDEVDSLSDIWACGAVMYHLLSGQFVHDGRTLNEQLMHAMTRPASRLTVVAPSVSLPVRQIVDRALSFAKDLRWPDAASMKHAIAIAYEELYGSPLEEAMPLAIDGFVAIASHAPPAHPPGLVEGSTSPPVVGFRSAATQFFRFAGPGQIAAGMAGMALLGAAVVFLLASPRGSHVDGSKSGAASHGAEVTFVDPATESPPVMIAPAPPPPEVAATDLPFAPPPPTASASQSPRRDPPPSAVGRAPSSATEDPEVGASSRPDCRPPYVVDAETGKKHWKIECL